MPVMSEKPTTFEDQIAYWGICMGRSASDIRFSLRIVPDYMHEGLARWITLGIRPGSFMEYLLCNDLMGAASQADDDNRRFLFEWCLVLYNDCPRGSFGSRENFNEWHRVGGLFGLQNAQQEEVKSHV